MVSNGNSLANERQKLEEEKGIIIRFVIGHRWDFLIFTFRYCCAFLLLIILLRLFSHDLRTLFCGLTIKLYPTDNCITLYYLFLVQVVFIYIVFFVLIGGILVLLVDETINNYINDTMSWNLGLTHMMNSNMVGWVHTFLRC